jgi:hypothetical protein
MLSRYIRYIAETDPSARTEAAYRSLERYIAADGDTIPKAFGVGGWAPSLLDNPYTGLRDLAHAARASRDHDGFVWISDANHNGAFLGSDLANLAFRAHHDAVHVLTYRGFHLLDECDVARATVNRLHLTGDAFAVLAGEIIGQGLYHQRHGCFPLTFEGRQPFFQVTSESRAWALDALQIGAES